MLDGKYPDSTHLIKRSGRAYDVGFFTSPKQPAVSPDYCSADS
jgi:hypothetical protein